MEKLNRTMNSDEAVILGTTYIGASQSSSFIVKTATLKSFCNIEVIFVNNEQQITLFEPHFVIAEPVSVTVPYQTARNFTIFADQSPTLIRYYGLENTTEIEDNDLVNLTFPFDTTLVPRLVNAQFNSTNV
jgi:hypothetical protein